MDLVILCLQDIFILMQHVSRKPLGAAPTSGNTASGPSPYLGSLLTSVNPAIAASPCSAGSITFTTPGTYLLTFCILLNSTTNPSTAHIVVGGTATPIGFAYTNSAVINISGSLIVVNPSGSIGLTLNYTGGSNIAINPASYYQAIRIA
jgi:hypothetical protein